MSVRFTQCCPTCGRRIQIQTTLLGRTVACQHCQAEFVSQLESEQELPPVNAQASQTESDPLMARVDALLAQSSQDAAARP
ncbi:MAG: response regulator [Planctomycetota bacterium]|nr:response regulator [Planctomycetota bacterium]